MLVPRKVKYRKHHRGRRRGVAYRGSTLQFGEMGLQAQQDGWITNNQIEAARVAMTRYMRRGGRVWITIFPHKPITKKPAEVRMGGGKGSPEAWVAVVKPGRIKIGRASCRERLRTVGCEGAVNVRAWTTEWHRNGRR